jgi:uncharacterized protein involved in response to NO
MLERTLQPFMRAAFGVELWQHARLNMAIKLLALLLVAAPWLPSLVVAAVAAALALLLTFRFARWHPLKAMQRIEIAVMFLGYGAIVLQLVLDVVGRLTPIAWVGSVSTHVFSFGVIGLIVPAMLIRISQGHTGRPIVFATSDRWALRIMLLAFLLRLVAPQLWPAAYGVWIDLAAACWLLCFTLLGVRLVPFLWQPRLDGREH